MCGIVGVLADRPVEAGRVEAMRDTLAHRGPDHAGLWTSPDRRTVLGNRRLAVIDPESEANQPFVSADGRLVLVYNGEVYNFRKLRRELRRGGTEFRTDSDTEVVLEAFRRWGPGCLERLSGMFAFAVWDERERRLFTARDRAGEKPFYYASVDGTFLFGSELKALVEWPGFRRDLRMTAVADFLTFGYVPDPRTIWEGADKLPPGHWVRVDLPPEGTPEVSEPVRWWDLSFRADRGVDDWGPEIRDTLVGAAQEMAVADVPLGTFLSGGVDSSAVTAALRRSGHPVASFTVGFEEEGYDERPWARRVADLYGTRHTERTVTLEDVEPVLDDLVWHYDEPFNDYSYLPTYYLCREARRDITVALSGDGGDELFAGYGKYRRIGCRAQMERWTGPVGTMLARAAARGVDTHHEPGRALVHYGSPVPEAMTDMLRLALPPEGLRRAARGPLADEMAHYSPVDTVAGHMDAIEPEDAGLIDTMRYLDLKMTLAGDILVKVDRASMAVSLEVRPVLLHREVLDLASRIPPERLAGPSRSKDALKSAVGPWLPHDLLHRDKQGFAMPLGRWIAAGSRGFSPELDEDAPLADLVDPTLMEDLLRAHRTGQSDETPRIHALYLLNRWLRQWL